MSKTENEPVMFGELFAFPSVVAARDYLDIPEEWRSSYTFDRKSKTYTLAERVAVEMAPYASRYAALAAENDKLRTRIDAETGLAHSERLNKHATEALASAGTLNPRMLGAAAALLRDAYTLEVDASGEVVAATEFGPLSLAQATQQWLSSEDAQPLMKRGGQAPAPHFSSALTH